MEEDGISLLDVWRLIVKKKIIGFITFGIVTILFLVLILFVYNPRRVNYEARFNYNWFGIENGKYANGTIFNYYDIISLDNLKRVKDSNDAYSNINIEGISEHIKVEVDDNQYQIKASGVYFKNDAQAKSFLEDLIKLPYQTALDLNFDFTANLSGFDRAKKISSKLDYLENQINLVLKGYKDMISYFGDIEINEFHLSNLYRTAEVFATNNDLKEYRYIAYQNYYMTEEEYNSTIKEREALKMEQELLRKRKSVLLESLRDIYTNSNGNTYMDTSIANYLNSLHTLDSRLMSIDETLRLIEGATSGKYNAQESQKFIEQLEEYKNKLESLTEEYMGSVDRVLEENTLFNLQPIEVKGKIRFSLAVIISLLVGSIAGLGVSLCLAFLDNYKNKTI